MVPLYDFQGVFKTKLLEHIFSIFAFCFFHKKLFLQFLGTITNIFV